MLKTLFLTLTVVATGGGAIAQTRAAPPQDGEPAFVVSERDLQASLEARMAARAALTGDRVDAGATLPLAPPPHWMAGEQAWRDHMRRCVRRYQTYDPATDLYLAQPGVERRCKL